DRARHDRGRALALSDMAFVSAYGDGDYARSRLESMRAEAALERSGGDRDIEFRIMRSRAGLFVQMGSGAEALPVARTAVAIAVERYGPLSFQTATALFYEANALSLLGRDREAILIFMRVLATYGATVGPEHPDVAATLSTLADSVR